MQAPIGYLISTGLIATLALSAVAGRRPRRSAPFRFSYAFGFVLNWPLVAFAFLVASTALALDESGSGLGFRIGLGFAIVGSAALAVLRRRARRTGLVLARALDEGLGPGWRERVDAELGRRLRRRPSLAHVLLAPISLRRHGLERIANIRFGPARGNLLDLYRDRSGRSGRPTLVYLHARLGSKRLGARHLLQRLAARGWVCVSANYRLNDSDPLRDVEQVIAWVRDHGRVDRIPPGADHLGETVHYVYDYTFPFTVRLDIQSDAGSTILFSPTLPIAARRSSMWVLFARNHSFDRPDGDGVAFSEAIWAEDQAVTPRDRPRASPGAAISTRNARARRAGASKRRGRMCTVAATRAVSMRRRRRVRRSGTSVIGPAG